MAEHRSGMLENSVLKGSCERNAEGVKRRWRKLWDGEFHNLHYSPYIIKTTKSGRMKLHGQCSIRGPEETCVHKYQSRNSERKIH